MKKSMVSSIISAYDPGQDRSGMTSPNPNDSGIRIVSLTGPICHIDEIDDYQTTTVSLLKDAIQHCLDLPDWITHNHIQLYLKGNQLTNDNLCLESVGIHEGAKICYVIIVAWYKYLKSNL